MATKSGAAGSQLGVKYIVDAPRSTSSPGTPTRPASCDKLSRQLVPEALANDAVYLYSRTAADRFAGRRPASRNLENDILQGRKPVSDWRVEADSWW